MRSYRLLKTIKYREKIKFAPSTTQKGSIFPSIFTIHTKIPLWSPKWFKYTLPPLGLFKVATQSHVTLTF